MKKILLFCSFILSIGALGQIKDLVQNNGITTPIHRANLGKIVFIAAPSPIEDYKDSDTMASVKLNSTTNLYLRAFMDNSVTNYLHRLDTNLTAEELLQKGNYQFSFWIDGKLVYVENLHHGAEWPNDKNSKTILTIPLVSQRSEESWGRSMWRRFYENNGGEQHLTVGTHQLKIEMHTYLDHNGLKISPLLAVGAVELVVTPPVKATEAEAAIQPIAPNSGWPVSKDAYATETIKELNRKIAESKFRKITSIVVIKKGELLIEEYFNGANRTTLHDTRSVGKSFASALTGIAIHDGYLKNEQQTLGEFYDLKKFENYSPQKEKVTLKSLLTMSSGFDGSDANSDSPGNEENMYPTDNWVSFALNLPMDKTKIIGKNWDYFTAGVVLLGDIINKNVPGGLVAYADKKLFAPLGITHYEWQYTPQNVGNTAGSLQMNTLDYAKFGQLYQNKGKWNGQQILTQDWVKKTFTNYFTNPNDPKKYGYLFWNQTYTVNGKNYDAFLCNGNGGNKIIVFTTIPLTIIITSTAYNSSFGHTQADEIVTTYLLPAILQ